MKIGAPWFLLGNLVSAPRSDLRSITVQTAEKVASERQLYIPIHIMGVDQKALYMTWYDDISTITWDSYPWSKLGAVENINPPPHTHG